MTATKHDALLDDIARTEAELGEIDKQRREAESRLAALRQQAARLQRPKLVTGGARPPAPATEAPPRIDSTAAPSTVVLATPPPPPTPVGVATKLTAAQKVRLFRQLFRGREDVFPKRWENAKAKASGYAPACSNEWREGICTKGQRTAGKRVKCGECPNQAWIPVSDRTVLDHLQGKFVMGVYPLLEDETCWLLAADFDGEACREDAAAFSTTCRSVGVPVALERSRSGNGVHAWFFFTAPVPARLARDMGSHLITKTMACRPALSMASYDRLFPSQDTMPSGGFGSLIALPFQHDRRAEGNTMFLNDALEAIPEHEQWAYLAALRRIDPARVEEIAAEAARHGPVVGVPAIDLVDEEDRKPWLRLPSGRQRPVPIAGPLPKEVQAVLAQRLFVETAGLPPTLVNQIKRLAAFQNPEFYKKQSMRLSTRGTPRVIGCAEVLPLHVALPRGCRSDVEDLLREHGVALVVDDQRQEGEPIEHEFQGELTPIQDLAARTLLKHDIGVFVAPPGIGKTVLGTYLIAKRARNTLVLVHRRPLLNQWIAQLAMFLGIDAKAVGQVGGGKRRQTGKLDVATVQSLVRKDRVDDLVAAYGHVIVDECHHVPAVSFERVMSHVKARYITGLTATPHRRDGHHPISGMQLGPVRFVVDPRSQAARGPFARQLIVRETAFRLPSTAADPKIQEIYRLLAADEARNDQIIDDVIRAVDEGRSPVLLTERRDHLELLAARLRGFVRHLVVLHGRMKAKQRGAVGAQLAAVPDGEERLVLATGGYIGEGFDDARLDTLFLTMPISWKGRLVQYAGRLHRLHPNKTEVRIFDYVDVEVPMLKGMFEKRLRGYRGIGYARGEAPLGYAEPLDEPTVEYDDDALQEAEPDF